VGNERPAGPDDDGRRNGTGNPLGVGDVVKISVYGSPDLNTETRVSDKGQITFPLIGQVPVGGLTAWRRPRKNRRPCWRRAAS
jgi:polysaccharide export outer membrane protein